MSEEETITAPWVLPNDEEYVAGETMLAETGQPLRASRMHLGRSFAYYVFVLSSLTPDVAVPGWPVLQRLIEGTALPLLALLARDFATMGLDSQEKIVLFYTWYCDLIAQLQAVGKSVLLAYDLKALSAETMMGTFEQELYLKSLLDAYYHAALEQTNVS